MQPSASALLYNLFAWMQFPLWLPAPVAACIAAQIRCRMSRHHIIQTRTKNDSNSTEVLGVLGAAALLKMHSAGCTQYTHF